MQSTRTPASFMSTRWTLWQEKEKAEGGMGSFERVRYAGERKAAAARDAGSKK